MKTKAVYLIWGKADISNAQNYLTAALGSA